MTPPFSPAWQRFFAQPAVPAPRAAAPAARPPFRRVPLAAPASAAVPPERVAPAGPTMGQSPDGATRRPASGGTSAFAPGAGAPPRRPTPVDQRPLPAESPRRGRELAWLTWQLPTRVQAAAQAALRGTLGWRAQHCLPLDPPDTPLAYTRFGLLGEQLVPQEDGAVGTTLRAEVRELVRVVEDQQPRLLRNRLLAMHSVRLGQLCAALEQRGLDSWAEVRGGLEVLRG